MARNFARRPSELLEIKNTVAALDFDRACSLRLLRHDNERDAKRFEIYFKTLGAMLTGKPPDYEKEEAEEW